MPLDATSNRAGLAPSVWIAHPHACPEPDDLDAALTGAGLTHPRPVLILVGGAANLSDTVAPALLKLFERIAPRLDALGAAVIDGGTAFGVMALMGRARRCTGARFPLIGIAPQGVVAIDMAKPEQPVENVGKASLDPDHTHFILVPGDGWGDESPWISAVADRLARGRGTLMLVAAGGEITRLDVMHRLRTGGRVLVLAGSGGTADRLADWRRDGVGLPDVGVDVGEAERDLVEVSDLADAPERLPALVEHALAR
ncbi:hypothetical protein [Thiocapsa rosea]|uniref:LSDAT prokaryote domain-containing protein n=1 Tax=Thiocapsa rosea TaxID=69360 RepID=A0A495V6I3_9GAMM|nr:hypothetical protein [Thiocapsa rosea]RKT45006.1 hypothetical protein BDD21_2418 [Thiocapsa rosea]